MSSTFASSGKSGSKSSILRGESFNILKAEVTSTGALIALVAAKPELNFEFLSSMLVAEAAPPDFLLVYYNRYLAIFIQSFLESFLS